MRDKHFRIIFYQYYNVQKITTENFKINDFWPHFDARFPRKCCDRVSNPSKIQIPFAQSAYFNFKELPEFSDGNPFFI